MTTTYTTTYTEAVLRAFDLETTGPDPFEARIVSWAVVEVQSSMDADKPLRLPILTEGICNPGVFIPPEASEVHGITNEIALERGASPRWALEYILHTLCDERSGQVPLVVFNASYDMTVLRREIGRHMTQLLNVFNNRQPGVILDPFVIDKYLDKYRRGSRKLVDMAKHYGCTVDEAAAHGAAEDAFVAGELTLRMMAQYGDFFSKSNAELMEAQTFAADEQRRSLAEYLRRNGETPVVHRGWPYLKEGEVY